MPESQGTPCSKQAWYLKFKWLERDSNLKLRYCACFEHGVPWCSGNYRMWIHSWTRTWHDKNIQSDWWYNQWYWCFLNKWFNLKSYLRNRCHDLLMLSMTLSDITNLKIKNADDRFISGISKNETIKILQNIYLTEK